MNQHVDPFLVQNISCPREIMRFRLVYRGPLPASGNSSKKPDDIRRIRDQFHPQLALLWETHRALTRLKFTSRVPDGSGGRYINIDGSPFEPEFGPSTPLQKGFVDLCEPIRQGDRSYIPLVRKSLDLTCSLDILFLRQEEPGSLVLQGGDLDGRIKTLFDALRIPVPDVAAKYPQAQNVTYCLMESDALISSFEVDSDRLLFPETTHPHEVMLIVDVGIKIMRMGHWNSCLAGD
jgi:hypothetical protein